LFGLGDRVQSGLQRDLVRLFDAVLLGLRDIAKLCASTPALRCIDSPVFTTTFLRSRGVGEYSIRRIWRAAKQRSVQGGQVLYHYYDTVFVIRPRVEHGIAYHHADTMVPVDKIDCLALGEKCYEVPNCNSFYIYLQGRIGHSSIMMSASYIIGLLSRTQPEFVSSILEMGKEAIYNVRRTKESLPRMLLTVLGLISREAHLLKMILPFVPQSLDDLLRVSPLAKKIYIEANER
jgi:hypothetical protein